MTTFGKRLRRLRNDRKLTMKQLGEKVGLTESGIGMIERGERNPSFDKLQELSDYFEVDINYLIGKTDNSVRKPVDKSELKEAEYYFYEVIGYRSDDDLMEQLDDQSKISLYKRLIATGMHTKNEIDKELGINNNENNIDVDGMLGKIDKFFELYSELNSAGVLEDLNKLGYEDRQMVYNIIKRLESEKE